MVALLRFLSFAVPSLLMSVQVLANPAPADVLHGLLARQTSPIDQGAIPEQCKSSCTVIQTLSGCADTTCICTDSNMDGISKCFDCAAGISKASASDVKTAQTVVDQLVDGCKAAGTPVKSITVSAKKNGGARLAAMSVGSLAVVAFGSVLALA
ncbi:hypothetical protein FPV67DRAFT_387439 [Lyophyllum atratum]|nr:hypothetical protein FPV67DRAFT_387439 [Lyophyllum atratum]